MNALKTVSVLALALGVASTTAFTGVPSTPLRLEGNTTAQSLPFVALHPHINYTYQVLPQLVVAPPISAPVNPLLLLDNTSCGMEEEAAEVATLQATSPMQPVTLFNSTMATLEHVFTSGQSLAKVCVWFLCI